MIVAISRRAPPQSGQVRTSTAKTRALRAQPNGGELDISWSAQKRLHARFQSITARRKSTNYAIVAMARELCGFIWAVGQLVTPARAAS